MGSIHQSDDLVEVVQFEIVRRYLLSLKKKWQVTFSCLAWRHVAGLAGFENVDLLSSNLIDLVSRKLKYWGSNFLVWYFSRGGYDKQIKRCRKTLRLSGLLC